jgi:dTDP-4-dehydrorhamnose 3,5-epimerase
VDTHSNCYKCSDYYQPDDQYVLRYDDPTLDIPWPDAAHALLSDKDQQGESFAQLQARLL